MYKNAIELLNTHLGVETTENDWCGEAIQLEKKELDPSIVPIQADWPDQLETEQYIGISSQTGITYLLYFLRTIDGKLLMIGIVEEDQLKWKEVLS